MAVQTNVYTNPIRIRFSSMVKVGWLYLSRIYIGSSGMMNYAGGYKVVLLICSETLE